VIDKIDLIEISLTALRQPRKASSHFCTVDRLMSYASLSYHRPMA